MPHPYIIYLYPSKSSFIGKDIKILKNEYDVVELEQNWLNKKALIPNLIKQFLFLLLKVPKSKCIFVMFGGWWSLLPSLLGKAFGKEVYIILGGTDCVSFPSLNYGSLRKPLLRNIIRYSYSLATRLLPVHDSLIFSTNLYFERALHKKQGVRYFFPELKTPYTTIYNGFDGMAFKKNNSEKAGKAFISIAGVSDQMRFELKGIKQIFNIAPHFPECRFTVIGIDSELKESLNNIPVNIRLLPFLDSEKFIEFLSQSTFYLQLSLSEGFPNALCEAMLCECVPIVSEVGAMPFIVQNTGYIVTNSSIESSVKTLTKALDESNLEIAHKAIQARSRILETFDIRFREKALLELIA